MSTADVSSILEKEGIIPSAKDFNDYVIDAGYHKEIRAYHFKVDSDMSFKNRQNINPLKSLQASSIQMDTVGRLFNTYKRTRSKYFYPNFPVI